MSILELAEYNFDSVVIPSDKPVLIDFWAPWCGPCKMLAPILNEIADENPDIVVAKVNVDEEPELARRFGVMSIPTLVVMKNGEQTNKSVGVKSKAAILDLI